MESLISRGWRVTDQICESFCKQVAFRCAQRSREAQYALENLVAAVDEHRNISLLVAFEKLYENALMGQNLIETSQEDEEIPKNCAKVRKVIITPTRLLFLSPEIMMSNRVIRRFGAEYAMRVLFRDDNQMKIRGSEFSHAIFERIVTKNLTEGIKVGNRHYQFLAWSNSQLRDVGCYMFAQTEKGETVETIKGWMGDFSNIKVGKLKFSLLDLYKIILFFRMCQS